MTWAATTDSPGHSIDRGCNQDKGVAHPNMHIRREVARYLSTSTPLLYAIRHQCGAIRYRHKKMDSDRPVKATSLGFGIGLIYSLPLQHTLTLISPLTFPPDKVPKMNLNDGTSTPVIGFGTGPSHLL